MNIAGYTYDGEVFCTEFGHYKELDKQLRSKGLLRPGESVATHKDLPSIGSGAAVIFDTDEDAEELVRGCTVCIADLVKEHQQSRAAKGVGSESLSALRSRHQIAMQESKSLGIPKSK